MWFISRLLYYTILYRVTFERIEKPGAELVFGKIESDFDSGFRQLTCQKCYKKIAPQMRTPPLFARLPLSHAVPYNADEASRRFLAKGKKKAPDSLNAVPCGLAEQMKSDVRAEYRGIKC